MTIDGRNDRFCDANTSMKNKGTSAQEYRERAEKLRAIATSKLAGEDRALLLSVAKECDQMARVLEVTGHLAWKQLH
jgi:hypothetical protein